MLGSEPHMMKCGGIIRPFVLFFAKQRASDTRSLDAMVGKLAARRLFCFFVSSEHASFATPHPHVFQLFKYNLGLLKGLTVSIEHL
jgi:hypothetical protein